uniref:DnaJ homologue subfamily C GRV2/DNAJC13 N-terminal domain-containing protein n=1 Tax=Guillardia theta TaxID=55529 RepID=A0A7S4N0A5_GUITH
MDLLSRILPASLFSSLRVPWQESATATLQQRGRSARVRSAVNNWPLLFQRLRSDLSDASLIWNESTRNELREALQEEEEALIASIEVYGASNVTWNDEDFFVHYRSLEQEVRVGAYYLRFVLFDDFDVEVLGSGASRFLGQLYHSFLTEQNPAVKVDCLLAMSKVYKRWSNQPFDSLTLSSLVRILADTDCSKNVRNALIDFLQTAICNPVNARNLLSFPLFIPSILQILSSSMSSDYVQMDWISMDKIGMTIKCANLLHVLVSRTSSKATNKIVRPLPLAQRVLSKDERVRQVVWLLLLPNETFLCRMLEIVEILLQQSGCCSFLPATKSLLLYLLINCVDFSRSIQSGSEQGEAVKDSLLEKAGKMIGQMWEGSENNNSCTCKIEVQETMLDLIPISLFLLLKKEGATSFVRTLSSERKDVSILWTRSMRERMSQALKLHLCRTLREEQEGKIGFERMPKIVYNEHIESDWLGCEDFGYYLSHLESSSSMVSPTDIVQFRQLILQRLADASTGLSTQAILLSLLANIMEENHVLQFEEDAHAVKQSEETEEAGKEDSSRFAEFKILAGLLKEDAMYQEEAGRGGGGGNRSPSRERMMVQMNVMRVCRWMVKASPDSSSTVSSTVSLCIQLGIADFVDSVLKQCISCMFVSRKPGEETNVLGGSTAGDSVDSQSESDCILQLTLAAIRFASDFARYPEGLNRWEREQGIVHVLLLCLQSDHSDIIQAAIECMGHVCSSQLLHAALIRGHFHLLLLRQLLRDVFAMTDGADRVTVSIVSIRTRCLSTCQALYSFAFGKHNTQEIQEELVCLLTAPMLERLDSAAEFLGIFAAEHRTPDLVWGSCNRRELRSLVKKTFKHLNVTSPQINEQPPSWPSLTGSPSVSEESASMSNDIAKFSYSNICNLTRVGGIYIEIFNDQPNWPLEDPATLLGKLFDAMAHGVEGNEMTDNQKVEAMKAALNIAKRLPSSSVLSSPTRIVLLADLLPAQEDFWEQEVLSGDQGSEGTSANSKQGKWKLYVLVFELLAVGSQDSRAAKILCEQGVAQRLLGFLNASLGIFSPSLCLDESHQAEAFDSSASCRELKDCLESVVVSTLRCLRQVSRFLPSQFRRLCQESYLTVLLLLLFKDSIPMSLRAEAASSISEFCTSENAERMKEYLKMVCPRHLVSELARPRKEDNQILHVVLAVDQDVKTEESEWNRDDCQEVLTFLCESRQNFSWEISRLSYLEKQESRRVGDYLIDNLNILLKEGKDQSQLIKDPASFFRICSEEVKHNTDTNEAIAEWPDGCERLKQVLESLGWLARGGLVPRSVWDEKAICLVPSLMKVLSAMSRSSHPIRPSQLRQIMRVLLPAVSCEGVSEFFRIPDNVRSLIWMVMEGSRHEDAAGEEVLAASVHILAAMMRENSSIVEVSEWKLPGTDGVCSSCFKTASCFPS